MLTPQQKEIIIRILMPYRPIRIGVFGSRARNTHRADSDLDLLICLSDSIGLLKLVQIEQELEDALKMPIDLVTEGALKHEILKAHVRRDLISIYEA